MPALLASIRGLLAYTIWADRQVLQALEGVPTEDLVRDTGTSFGSVLGTMAHILGSEQVWLSRFLGVSLQSLPSTQDFPDLASVRSSWEDFWPQLEVFLASLAADQIEQDFTWTNFAGETHTVPLRQALFHLVNHSTYHRGQVVSQLRQLGRSAPSTDLVYWRGTV